MENKTEKRIILKDLLLGQRVKLGDNEEYIFQGFSDLGKVILVEGYGHVREVSKKEFEREAEII